MTPTRDKIPSRARALLGIVLGAIACVIAVLIAQVTFEFVHSSVTTQGRIVRLTYGEHHAEAEFRASNGERVEFPVSTSGAWVVGETIAVRYDPSNPKAGAQLDSFMSIWWAPLLFGTIGLFSILNGAIQLRR